MLSLIVSEHGEIRQADLMALIKSGADKAPSLKVFVFGSVHHNMPYCFFFAVGSLSIY